MTDDQTKFWYKYHAVGGIGINLQIEKELHKEQTPYQEIRILQSTQFGNVLLLDDDIQLTEKDEYAYHEMMVHLAMCCHPNPSKILVIGGGDGGCVREILKHSSVQQVILCEIDQRVIEISKQYLPHCTKGLEDERVQIVIGDGIQYMKRHRDEFDVIFTDVPDDGEAVDSELYNESYYRDLSQALREDGIACSQGNSMLDMHVPSIKRMTQFCQRIFPVVEYANAIVPSYCGGHNGFLLISKNKETYFNNPCITLNSNDIETMQLRYYNTSIHRASLCLPQVFREKICLSGDN